MNETGLDVPMTIRQIVDLCGDLEQACLDMDPRKAEDTLYGLMMRARAFRQYLTEGGCLPFPERAT